MKSRAICTRHGGDGDDDDEMLKSAGCVMETVRPAASHCKSGEQICFYCSEAVFISEAQMLIPGPCFL